MADTRNKRPDLPGRIAATLASCLPEGKTLAIGYSGGRDSACLLHCLNGLKTKLGLNLCAIHVHHGLSAHADNWAKQCEAFCEKLSVPFLLKHVEVDQSSGQGIEAAARHARYQAFSTLDVDAVVVAHHREDQSETLLLNLFRGAGVAGAAAMPVTRPIPRLSPLDHAPPLLLVRPLLDTSRAEIEAYVDAHRIPFIDDDSNTNTHFRRNYLRTEVMPAVRSRFPTVDTQLAQAATHFAAATRLLNELAEMDIARLTLPAGLDRQGVATLSADRQRNLLRRWLVKNGERAPDTDTLEEIRHQLHSPRHDATTRISLPGAEIRVWRGCISLEQKTSVAPVASLRWQGEETLPWNRGMLRFTKRQGAGILLTTKNKLEIRPRQGGEQLRLAPNGRLRLVKKWLQEKYVPPWLRDQLPFLWIDDQFIGIPGLGLSASYLAAPEETGMEIEWKPPGT